MQSRPSIDRQGLRPATIDFLVDLSNRLDCDAERFVEELTFGRPESELRRAESAVESAWGFFLPLSATTCAYLEQERFDMLPEGWEI